jgi:nicotinate phosphoribosyltransferase
MSESSKDRPTNPLVTALLTDLYQITMTYAHWKVGKHNESSVFELFFRKNPFKGEFTIFCGLDECLKHFDSFSFSEQDIEYLKSTPSLCHCEDAYFEYLMHLDTSALKVQALQEGTVVFPRIPMIILEAPLGLGQLLETTLLNLVNYPSLLATNAARMVLRAQSAPCIEFGLRRAQGPDGACSASKYAYVGGFAATSNVQAGKLFGVPIAGTHAHAYVQAFSSLDDVQELKLVNKRTSTSTAQQEVFLPHVLKYRESDDDATTTTNDGELAAFVAYACAFPDNCLCLIDTYDTVQSGLQNFIFVAMALDDFGYCPKGVRLDSGDLAALSLECAKSFQRIRNTFKREAFSNLSIVVSNDINEQVLNDLSGKPHGITVFGIGTNLVTCQAQPALGCVYKLVEWKGQPRIKISQDLPKVSLPGRKRVYRLIGREGKPLLDYMALAEEKEPSPGIPITCRNPFHPQERLQVTPSEVIVLHSVVFAQGKTVAPPILSETRSYVQEGLAKFPAEITRYDNPRPYDVMVSPDLFRFLHELWEREAPMEARS